VPRESPSPAVFFSVFRLPMCCPLDVPRFCQNLYLRSCCRSMARVPFVLVRSKILAQEKMASAEKQKTYLYESVSPTLTHVHEDLSLPPSLAGLARKTTAYMPALPPCPVPPLPELKSDERLHRTEPLPPSPPPPLRPSVRTGQHALGHKDGLMSMYANMGTLDGLAKMFE
ncbi:unnamed protein product, partial [Scytosiphon promiscuus]